MQEIEMAALRRWHLTWAWKAEEPGPGADCYPQLSEEAWAGHPSAEMGREPQASSSLLESGHRSWLRVGPWQWLNSVKLWKEHFLMYQLMYICVNLELLALVLKLWNVNFLLQKMSNTQQEYRVMDLHVLISGFDKY